MSKGFEGIREAASDIRARREAGGGGWVERFKLPNDGDTADVRFLEQGEDVAWCWVHQLPVREGQNYGDNEVCLNTRNDGTPCPGCEKGHRRLVNGFINLIHRDAPVWRREDGRLVKTQAGELIKDGERDQVKVWRGGITLFEELDGIDATYKGLMSRDFRVTRRGIKLNTKYTIVPVDPDGGPQPMSDADRKLAESKHDLTPMVTPPPYDEWGKPRDGGQGQQQQQGQPVADVNPFLRPRS